MVRELFDHDRAGGQDAVCFTAGPPGAYFGAGTVHAYLAAARSAPVVVTGISSGAVSAAAMYKVYRDLAKVSSQAKPGQVEAVRWAWYRQYLEQITYSPLDFVWDAIPNPIDFFAESIPVEDPSCPDELKQAETEARIQHHRLIRLGLWVAGLRVTVGDLGDIAVRYVRVKEGYALWGWQFAALGYRMVRVGFLLAWRTVSNPGWVWRLPVLRKGRVKPVFQPSPLFGYRIWVGGLVWAFCTLLLPGLLLGYGRGGCALLCLAFGALTPALLLRFAFHKLVRLCLKPMGLHRGLLHKYPLKRALARLFEKEVIERPLDERVPTLLIVAAPINQRMGGKSISGSNQQFWGRTNSGMRVDHALLTALSNPGLYAPEVHGEGGGPIEHWVSSTQGEGLDYLEMVDGAVIRTNPIPALFVWLRGMWEADRHGARAQVERLFTQAGRPGCSLNIVYGVPLDPLPEAEAKQRETINVVENGFASLALERRRDTELESKQTEFMSKFETHIRSQEKTIPELPMFPILPNPIAPERDITFGNNLKPDRAKALEYVAQGCRRTLESLHAHRLADAFGGTLDCHTLLREVAENRGGFITPLSPGLSEVCASCSRVLNRPVRADEPMGTYGLADRREIPATFPKLVGDQPQPRIVFLASGGVFRGTFHAGVLAALSLARVKPDMVVGASVGAIVGAALAAQSALDDPAVARDHIHQLVRVFLRVDVRVALTRALKNVTKLLGVRGRSTDVSPALIRHLIAEGSRLDPAFAITGAPPLLIDAISNLFLLPHAITREVAASFVAGHIAEAMNLFWKGVQAETLQRLEIDDCVMGSDLLEPTARGLLFPEQLVLSPNPTQPYLPRTAFFATATNVNRRMPVILGRDLAPGIESYNFLESCLASAAFPVVFGPRSESDLIPGRGSTGTLLSDGGIFDNLPFFPAIRVLSEVQESAGDVSKPQQAYEDLKTRFANPVLIIAAALDSDFQGTGADANTYGLWQAANRLRANVKLFSFCQSAELVFKQIRRYLAAFADHTSDVDARFVNRIVPNCVLPILPTDPDHLNGTFAFSRSAGLKQERVLRSIADGCFRTLLELSDSPAAASLESLQVSLQRAIEAGLVARVHRLPAPVPNGKRCPYFEVDGQPFDCHFTQGGAPVPAVHKSCCADALHQKPALATSPASQKP